MRTTRSDLESSQNRESSQGYAADHPLGHLWRNGLQAFAPPGSRKKIWGKKKSPLWVCLGVCLWVCLSIYLSNLLCTRFENKMRERFFIKKCASFRSLKFVHYLGLCSWLGLWEVYNTTDQLPIAGMEGIWTCLTEFIFYDDNLHLMRVSFDLGFAIHENTFYIEVYCVSG